MDTKRVDYIFEVTILYERLRDATKGGKHFTQAIKQLEKHITTEITNLTSNNHTLTEDPE